MIGVQRRTKDGPMSLEDERAVFLLAHHRWNAGDLDGFMECIAPDIVYTVNVDGTDVPYAASANGKDEVRRRLQLLLDTFVVNAFVVESMVHEKEESRSRVLGYYRHKKTGERLDIKVGFRGRVKDGLLTRIDEQHDAAYIEAFERFVRYIEQTAIEAGAAV
jgi:ketosteroid isomerase-like protein